MRSRLLSTLRTEDIAFVKNAKHAVKKEKMGFANLILFTCAVSVIAFAVWASHAEIDEVTKGQGKVIPSSSIQTVQNLEGGIVKELLINEGDLVRKGDILLRIDDTISNSVFRESLAKRDSLEALKCRLEAEANDWGEIRWTERIKRERPDLVEQETGVFQKKRTETNKLIANETAALGLIRKQLEMTKPLVRDRVLPEVDQIQLEREVVATKGKIDELIGAGPQKAFERLSEVNGELESINEMLAGREDQVTRTEVRSPVDGTVNRMHVRTLGGVVKPGEPIVDIVPVNDTLLVEANINPSDIGFLRPGQKATVKLTAYDFSIYGGLEGEVEQISADTIYDEIERKHYYQVKIRNRTGKIEKNGEDMPIIPGMIAEVDVLTGRRTVMQYLTKPFHRARYNSLRER